MSAAIVQRMQQHDDNAEGRWLWSGKGDRRRLVGGWTWFSFAIGISFARDWEVSAVGIDLGPASLGFEWEHPHVWADAGEVNELAVAFVCLLGLLLAPVILAVTR